MKNQSQFASSSLVFIASIILFVSLLNLGSSFSYHGFENNNMADNWGLPLVVLLTFLFDLGWWFGSYAGRLLLLKRLKAFVIASLGIVFLASVIVFSTLSLTSVGFFRNAMSASGYILLSGFLFRLSVMRAETDVAPQNND